MLADILLKRGGWLKGCRSVFMGLYGLVSGNLGSRGPTSVECALLAVADRCARTPADVPRKRAARARIIQKARATGGDAVNVAPLDDSFPKSRGLPPDGNASIVQVGAQRFPWISTRTPTSGSISRTTPLQSTRGSREPSRWHPAFSRTPEAPARLSLRFAPTPLSNPRREGLPALG